MKLHYSQTPCIPWPFRKGFTTLWNYTTLKPERKPVRKSAGFTTLWNYTTLKPLVLIIDLRACFTTLWNYTTLKLGCLRDSCRQVLLPYEITLLSNFDCKENGIETFYYLMKLHYSQTVPLHSLWAGGFTTLWNYTTLKLHCRWLRGGRVLLPYEITLLSNHAEILKAVLLGFTTLWNYTTLKQRSCREKIAKVLLPYEITLLSNLKWE